MGDQKNLLLAILASLVVLLGFQLLFPTKEVPKTESMQEINENFAPTPEILAETPKARNQIISESARINIENKFINGSINLTGARIDDIILNKQNKNVKEFCKTECEKTLGRTYHAIHNSSDMYIFFS